MVCGFWSIVYNEGVLETLKDSNEPWTLLMLRSWRDAKRQSGIVTVDPCDNSNLKILSVSVRSSALLHTFINSLWASVDSLWSLITTMSYERIKAKVSLSWWLSYVIQALLSLRDTK